MNEVPVLITTNSCPRCEMTKKKLDNLGIPYVPKLVPHDGEATKVASDCNVRSAGDTMYYSSDLTKVFSVESYIELVGSVR